MLILPRHEYRVLHRKPLHEWREPSQRIFPGIQNRTWFSLVARTSDGVRFWRGWFEDWEDADAFLWALTLHQQTGVPIPRDIRRLPTLPSYPHTFLEHAWRPARYYGEWREEWSDLPLVYEKLAVTSFITSPTGSNQTWTSPSDWNNATNTIEGIGAGGSGGAVRGGAVRGAGGGGGGAYAKIVNFTVATPGTTTATTRVGTGGAAVQQTGTNGNLNGNSGGGSWFNNTAQPTAGTGNTELGATPGLFGEGVSGGATGGPGGVATSSAGSTRFSGGQGGNSLGSGTSAGGGAGAGGTTANGTDGVDCTAQGGEDGGAGGATNGGAGGQGTDTTGTPGVPTAGGTGTVWDASHGAGGGGGGARNGGAGNSDGGAGGLYGGGGGGSCGSGTITSGAGAQGILVVIYTPVVWGVARKMHQYRRRRV